MVENQHKLISGYRDLSEAEIEEINGIKSMGQDIGEFIEQLSLMQGVDQRWVSIGRTHMQQGIMALVRSVARPETF